MKRAYPYHYDLATGLYARLADQKFWKASISELIRFIGSQPGSRVLDTGCGHGISTFMLAEAFPGAQITGIDVARNMIKRAEKKKSVSGKQLDNIHFSQADASRLPFEDNSFDTVTGHGFLYMIKHRDHVLKELNRVLKPGGTAAFMEPGTSIDAIGRSAVIKDTFRNPKPKTHLGTKMLLIRLYSTRKGSITPREMESEFIKAGFRDFTWQEGVSGRGLLFKAIKI
jgi:ubiquinone/menaquinone biosynthesis C-methylase UbiE